MRIVHLRLANKFLVPLLWIVCVFSVWIYILAKVKFANLITNNFFFFEDISFLFLFLFVFLFVASLIHFFFVFIYARC